jgi:threonine dehydratase
MKNIIVRTPLELNKRLSQKYNCNLYFKREDLQTVRSFKIRGAYNKIINNSDNNFVTASAGNHAQGVSHVCNSLNKKCYIFVPETTPNQKVSRIKYFGGDNCTLYKKGNTFDESLYYSKEFCEKNNYTFVHPFDDPDVISGQGNVTKEILEDINPDIIMCAVGGGGLISGTINAVANNNCNNCNIYGIEPMGAASMYESLKQGKVVTLDTIDTFVDGACVKRVGELTFEIAKKAKEIIKISNGELCTQIIDLYQNEGIIVEPAGALSVAGLSKIEPQTLENKNVVCIISGGNNDLMRYPEIVENSMRHLNLRHYFIITFQQKPNELRKYIENVLVENTDITRFEYIKKNNRESGTVLICIEVIQTEQIEEIKINMNKNSFDYVELLNDNLLYNYLI